MKDIFDKSEIAIDSTELDRLSTHDESVPEEILDRKNKQLLKNIILTGLYNFENENADSEVSFINALYSYKNFCTLFFDHPLFSGSGKELLAAIQVNNKEDFTQFVTETFSEEQGTILLVQNKGFDMRYVDDRKEAIGKEIYSPTIEEDIRYLLEKISTSNNVAEFDDAIYAVFGPFVRNLENIEDIDFMLEELLRKVVGSLKEREIGIVRQIAIHERNFSDVGKNDYGLDDDTIKKIYRKALEKIRLRLLYWSPELRPAIKVEPVKLQKLKKIATPEDFLAWQKEVSIKVISEEVDAYVWRTERKFYSHNKIMLVVAKYVNELSSQQIKTFYYGIAHDEIGGRSSTKKVSTDSQRLLGQIILECFDLIKAEYGQS